MAVEHFSSLESILGLVHERNYRETFPFVSIHDRCSFLEQQVEEGEKRCEDLQRQISFQGNSNVADTSSSGGPPSGAIGESAALRNERRMREQLEKLEQELKSEKARHEEDVEKMGKCQKELKDLKEVHLVQEQSLIQLQNQIDEKQKSLDHVTSKVEDSQQRTKLAEQQYVGLKETIRTLQDENDEYQKENRQLEQRLLSEKERLSAEMNSLTDTVEKLKRQLEMFGNLQNQHGAAAAAAGDSTDQTNVATTTTTSTTSSTSSWFGFSSKRTTPTPISESSTGTTGTENSSVANQQQQQPATTKNVVEIKSKPEERRQFGSFSVVVPSEPKQTITAHHGEALCVRYDDSESEFLATGGADASINIWNTATGSLNASLKAGGSNAILSCDLAGHLVACGGSDRSCRIYNVKTKRLVHQLVGHSHKITSVRFFDGARGIITASADRRLKVWDISKTTYRQLTSIHLNSTANSIDVAFDSSTIVTGHVDGGVRLFDIRTGQRTLEIEALHHGAITCIQFHPRDLSRAVTNGMDSKILVVDLKTSKTLTQLNHPEFQTSYNWSSSCFSPDGLYVASGSSSNGHIFVWEVESGKLIKQLKNGHHDVGVCGFAWGCSGNNGQQCASVDKSGRLVLWA